MTDKYSDGKLPVIDISDLNREQEIAKEISTACKENGFFYIKGHGIDQSLLDSLENKSRDFFSHPEAEKMQWRMELAKQAWRGYFPLCGELTSNLPDWKEGLYLGTELDDSHPLVQKKTPLHGRNLFPDFDKEFKSTILNYIESTTKLGHRLMELIALSLQLPRDYFQSKLTLGDPLILFRLFNYPSQPEPQTKDGKPLWGVGEHTDYGLLTILYQDTIGGLEVKSRGGWINAPPVPNTFVINIGDMLDRMTGGLYRSTPHRVRLNTSGTDRLSFPLFYDPNFFVSVKPIENLEPVENQDDSATRWDNFNLHKPFEGTYGDYLLNKIGKVFPQLKDDVL
ncbi:putative iron/ascorbate oxidoreductase [Tieghemostelium lacteum]|uniref:Putative iron/ascorbate oxidoreductase n=1 Tax=Tieghemostelium lacteum TaxID=361077 RepID=A0A151ZFG1_TIELA|nr:putative iron/ascorbate oxidoreductase [Tieghemostelium lacteum]|eukprot:KYQ92649.1 putative iron/ascorbate oxidoreductase [Tieghemostelium lacteum]